jgi:hypothetical protein
LHSWPDCFVDQEAGPQHRPCTRKRGAVCAKGSLNAVMMCQPTTHFCSMAKAYFSKPSSDCSCHLAP